jgi:hypothetical protein
MTFSSIYYIQGSIIGIETDICIYRLDQIVHVDDEKQWAKDGPLGKSSLYVFFLRVDTVYNHCLLVIFQVFTEPYAC